MIVQVDSRIMAPKKRPTQRKSHMWKKVTCVVFVLISGNSKNQFLSTFEPTSTVSELWIERKLAINTAIDKHVPTKMSISDLANSGHYRKMIKTKYSAIYTNHWFIPVVVETMGQINQEGSAIL